MCLICLILQGWHVNQVFMYWLHITHYHLEHHICKIESNIKYKIVPMTPPKL